MDDFESCWAILRPRRLQPPPPEEPPSPATAPVPVASNASEPSEAADLTFDDLVAQLHPPCDHVLDPALTNVHPESDDDGVVVSVGCARCGAGGRAVIETGTVDWTPADGAPRPAVETALELATELREATIAWLANHYEEPELATILGDADIVDAEHGPGRTLVVRLRMTRPQPCWWSPVCEGRITEVSGGHFVIDSIDWMGGRDA